MTNPTTSAPKSAPDGVSAAAAAPTSQTPLPSSVPGTDRDANTKSNTYSAANHPTTRSTAEEGVTAASATETLPPNMTSTLSTIDAGKEAGEKDAMPPMTKEEMVQEALNCPCISKMKNGPCGTLFLTAFECFLRSEAEPKGSDCVPSFAEMHDCLKEHPEAYDE